MNLVTVGALAASVFFIYIVGALTTNATVQDLLPTALIGFLIGVAVLWRFSKEPQG